MTDVLDLVSQAICGETPLVLLLGQHAWAAEGGTDTVLEIALHRQGKAPNDTRAWRALLDTPSMTEDSQEWLAERFERRVQPKAIEALGELPWSAVFTSSLDSTLHRLFSGNGREPETILTSNEFPKAVRSRARPPIYYLFSRAGAHDPVAWTPRNPAELNARRINHAVPMLNRLAETVTPVGYVFVEGYRPGSDWLRIEDLLGTITARGVGRILWFGGNPQIQGDDEIEFHSAVMRGQITIVDASLSSCISDLQVIGRLADITPPTSDDVGTVSLAGRKRLETSPELRLRVEAAASVVDDSWTAFLQPMGPDSDYSLFRRFHGRMEGPRLLVEGVRRSYAIEREFETSLLETVRNAVANHSTLDGPIMVSGQSSTGKSIALARIVARIREEQGAAVLYAVGHIPQAEDVSSFCQTAEEAGARATLIVSDSNRDVDLYFDLFRGLRSRGRRVVVLGSQYLAPDGGENVWKWSVEAPVVLSQSEQEGMADLLAQYVSRPDPSLISDNNMLTFVYRFLPASRPRISRGLGDEAVANEQVLRELGKQSLPVLPISRLHSELIRTGFFEDYRPVFNEEQHQILLNRQDAASAVIDLVMVAGQLDCPVPLNLLIRAATNGSQDIDLVSLSDLFGKLGLFRWDQRDRDGNQLLVGPRLVLEAQLICRRRLGSPEEEANRLVRLMGAVRSGVEREEERRFLLNLLQQLNPDGQRNNRYRPQFALFARELTRIRRQHNVLDARLMLQESAFRRAAVRTNTVPDNDILPLLEEARDAIQEALDRIDTGSLQAPRRTKHNLLVERAALYGFLSRDRARRQAPPADIWSSYQAARTAVKQAATATESYYPLDVGLWTPADLLDTANLLEWHKGELIADIYSTLDQVERDALLPGQRNNFDARQMKIGTTLNNRQLTEDAYKELQKNGSTAGFYLRARHYAPSLPPDAVEINEESDIDKAKSAASYLEQQYLKIKDDPRCLYLLLECRWIASMRRRPLRGERQPLPWEGRVISEFLDLVKALNKAAGDSSRHGLRYLEAVLTWLAGDHVQAKELFHQLDTETDFEIQGRVIKRHLVTDSGLAPRHFQGRIERRRGEHDWEIRVEGLAQLVRLRGRDFPHDQVAYGRTIRDFGIAFNFIGPIADPLR